MEQLIPALFLVLAISLVLMARAWMTRGSLVTAAGAGEELEQAKALLEALLPGASGEAGLTTGSEGEPLALAEPDRDLEESLIRYFARANASKAVLLSLLPHPDGTSSSKPRSLRARMTGCHKSHVNQAHSPSRSRRRGGGRP